MLWVLWLLATPSSFRLALRFEGVNSSTLRMSVDCKLFLALLWDQMRRRRVLMSAIQYFIQYLSVVQLICLNKAVCTQDWSCVLSMLYFAWPVANFEGCCSCR